MILNFKFLKMILMMGILFIISTQPMMVISSLILTILLYSFMMLWELSSFWFSYMIVLVLMSGVLVVFTYMMSVLPNESFEISGLVVIVMILVGLCKYFDYSEYITEMDLLSSSIWKGMTFSTSLILVIYLLGMMVMVVWLSMMEKGAIRIS